MTRRFTSPLDLAGPRGSTMSGDTGDKYTVDTHAGSVEVVRAQLADLAEVADILEEARQWLISKGITDQWPCPAPPEAIAWSIERHTTYLAYRAGKAIATFTLQASDEATWGPLPDEAQYLHGLAVRRAFAGQQIGARLLQLAAEISRAAGKQYLRLDCWAGNEPLSRYYERAGFEYRGTKRWPSTGEGPDRGVNLFERKLVL
jgi:ribosomal protein S18 acetylase RimI-like enzyme